MAAKDSGGGTLLLLAALGAGAYFFWPNISAFLSNLEGASPSGASGSAGGASLPPATSNNPAATPAAAAPPSGSPGQAISEVVNGQVGTLYNGVFTPNPNFNGTTLVNPNPSNPAATAPAAPAPAAPAPAAPVVRSPFVLLRIPQVPVYVTSANGLTKPLDTPSQGVLPPNKRPTGRT